MKNWQKKYEKLKRRFKEYRANAELNRETCRDYMENCARLMTENEQLKADLKIYKGLLSDPAVLN